MAESSPQKEELAVEEACTSLASLMPYGEEAGITHNCGVFGCIAAGEWPTHIDVAQIICLGLVALQHRLVGPLWNYEIYLLVFYWPAHCGGGPPTPEASPSCNTQFIVKRSESQIKRKSPNSPYHPCFLYLNVSLFLDTEVKRVLVS